MAHLWCDGQAMALGSDVTTCAKQGVFPIGSKDRYAGQSTGSLRLRQWPLSDLINNE
jgi:hypothetical protein